MFSLFYLLKVFSLTKLKGDAFFTGFSGRRYFLCYTLCLEKAQSIQKNLKMWSDSLQCILVSDRQRSSLVH